MRPLLLAFAIFTALLPLLAPGPAHAGRDRPPAYFHRWARVEVFDRTAGPINITGRPSSRATPPTMA